MCIGFQWVVELGWGVYGNKWWNILGYNFVLCIFANRDRTLDEMENWLYSSLNMQMVAIFQKINSTWNTNFLLIIFVTFMGFYTKSEMSLAPLDMCIMVNDTTSPIVFLLCCQLFPHNCQDRWSGGGLVHYLCVWKETCWFSAMSLSKCPPGGHIGFFSIWTL